MLNCNCLSIYHMNLDGKLFRQCNLLIFTATDMSFRVLYLINRKIRDLLRYFALN